MKKIDIIFIVEHKDRELPAYIKIRENLLRLGIKSIILQKYFTYNFIYDYHPKIIVFPQFYHINNWPVVEAFKFYGDSVLYVNMNWEQLLSSRSREAKMGLLDEFAKEKVRHLSWSNDFNKILLNYDVKAEHIHIVGNPNQYLLHSSLHLKKMQRQKLANEYGLDLKKEWIFFPMNYAWAFQTPEKIEMYSKIGFDTKQSYDFKSYSNECFQKFIGFVIDICNTNKYEIIIRPHPSIGTSTYKKFFDEISTNQKVDNLYLTRKYTIKEWIVASDIIGSSWSTSVYDSFKIGKKSFFYTPISRPQWLDTSWMNEVENLSSFKEFMIWVSQDSHNNIQNLDFAYVNECVNFFEKQCKELDYLKPNNELSKADILRQQKVYHNRYFNYKLLGISDLDEGALYDLFKPIGISESVYFFRKLKHFLKKAKHKSRIRTRIKHFLYKTNG